MLDLLAGERTERTELEMVRTKPLPFPPEPFAWTGIALTKWSLARADAHGGRRNLWLKTMDQAGPRLRQLTPGRRGDVIAAGVRPCSAAVTARSPDSSLVCRTRVMIRPDLPLSCDATSVDTREGRSAMTTGRRRRSSGWHPWRRIRRPAGWEWERNPLGVALLPAGRLWDVLILPGELGYPTLDVLTRVIDRPGPVLVDFGDARMGFFVPAGTAARWLGTGVRGAGRGTWIVVPHPHPGRPPAGSAG